MFNNKNEYWSIVHSWCESTMCELIDTVGFNFYAEPFEVIKDIALFVCSRTMSCTASH